MIKRNFISLFCIVLVFVSVLCALETALENNIKYKFPSSQNKTSTTSEISNTSIAATAKVSDTTQKPTKPKYEVTENETINLSVGKNKNFKLSKAQMNVLVSFESSNTSVANVDDGGRIDAVKKGTAQITATLKNYEKIICKVTVNSKEKSVYDGYSTCIIDNQDIVAKNKKKDSEKNLYFIKVNRNKNCVTVYTYDEDGKYTIPVRAMVCSCGMNNGTILGEFGIYFKNEWHALYQNVYGHYVSGISGDYLFHSVPFLSPQSDTLETEEFNKLGKDASIGCVRLQVADAKWIFVNCPTNTGVKIYDDTKSAGPLGKPGTIKITDKNCNWDPTDSNPKNPYKNKTPIISGAKDITINQGDKIDFLDGIKAKDTCSNDITSKIKISGNVITTHKGKYKVTYFVEDAMHRTMQKDIVVTVK